MSLLPPAVGANEGIVSDPRSGLALGGLDPVSYWLPGGPKPGLAGTELLWRGVMWRFRGAANRAAFLRDPESFLPRFGGYDAVAAAEGGIAAPDPLLYVLQGNRLYLFRTEPNRRRFLETDGIAAESEARWPRASRVLARG